MSNSVHGCFMSEVQLAGESLTPQNKGDRAMTTPGYTNANILGDNINEITEAAFSYEIISTQLFALWKE